MDFPAWLFGHTAYGVCAMSESRNLTVMKWLPAIVNRAHYLGLRAADMMSSASARDNSAGEGLPMSLTPWVP